MILEGVAHLLGLVPPPDAWTLVAWSEQIHKSPSDMSQEDMYWAQIAAERKWALHMQAMLKSGVRGAKVLDTGEWLEFTELKNEAKKLYASA